MMALLLATLRKVPKPELRTRAPGNDPRTPAEVPRELISAWSNSEKFCIAVTSNICYTGPTAGYVIKCMFLNIVSTLIVKHTIFDVDRKYLISLIIVSMTRDMCQISIIIRIFENVTVLENDVLYRRFQLRHFTLPIGVQWDSRMDQSVSIV